MWNISNAIAVYIFACIVAPVVTAEVWIANDIHTFFHRSIPIIPATVLCIACIIKIVIEYLVFITGHFNANIVTENDVIFYNVVICVYRDPCILCSDDSESFYCASICIDCNSAVKAIGIDYRSATILEDANELQGFIYNYALVIRTASYFYYSAGMGSINCRLNACVVCSCVSPAIHGKGCAKFLLGCIHCYTS